MTLKVPHPAAGGNGAMEAALPKFQKGTSGNPLGRPREVTLSPRARRARVRKHSRRATAEYLRTLSDDDREFLEGLAADLHGMGDVMGPQTVQEVLELVRKLVLELVGEATDRYKSEFHELRAQVDALNEEIGGFWSSALGEAEKFQENRESKRQLS